MVIDQQKGLVSRTILLDSVEFKGIRELGLFKGLPMAIQ